MRQGAYGDTFFIISQGRVSKTSVWISNEAEILFDNIEIYDTCYKQRNIFFGSKHANDDVEKVFLVIFIINTIFETIICTKMEIDKNQVLIYSF